MTVTGLNAIKSFTDFISFTLVLFTLECFRRFKPILISHQENAKGTFQMITINKYICLSRGKV